MMLGRKGEEEGERELCLAQCCFRLSLARLCPQ